MQTHTIDLPAPPMGLVDALAYGFELLAHKLSLMALPLILDLFLWLGPRISIKSLLDPAIERYFALLRDYLPPENIILIDEWQQMLNHQTAQANVLGVLSTAPIGAPSLMGWLAPDVVPLSPVVVSVESLPLTLGVVVGGALVGFLLGGLYLGLLAYHVRGEPVRYLWRRLPGYWRRLMLLALLLIGGFLLPVLPFIVLASGMSHLSPMIGLFVLAVGTSIGLWALIFLGFGLHAILLNDLGLVDALRQSIHVVRAHAPATMLFLLLLAVVYWGLGLVFRGEVIGILTPDSWLWCLGLIGHAFVATGLFIATFVYYEDRLRHYEEFRAYLAQQR